MSRVRQLWRTNQYRLLTDEESIQRYFGEGVALYFAWMNCFTSWLVLPGLLSVFVALSYSLTGKGRGVGDILGSFGQTAAKLVVAAAISMI